MNAIRCVFMNAIRCVFMNAIRCVFMNALRCRMNVPRCRRRTGTAVPRRVTTADNSGSWGVSCHTVEGWRCITTPRIRGG
jgi:hypothetical protein